MRDIIKLNSLFFWCLSLKMNKARNRKNVMQYLHFITCGQTAITNIYCKHYKKSKKVES